MVFSIVFIVRNNPEDIGQRAYGIAGVTDIQNSKHISHKDTKQTGLTTRKMCNTKCFKYYTLTVISIGILYGGVVNHLFAYFTDIGYDNSHASTLISLHMFFLLCGKFLLGIIFDKFGIIIGSLLSLSSYLIALLSLVFAEVKGIAFIYTLFGGLGVSIVTVGSSYITGNFLVIKIIVKTLA